MKNVKNLYIVVLLLCSCYLGAQKIENFDLNVKQLKSSVNYQKFRAAESGSITFAIEGYKLDLVIIPNKLMSQELRSAYPSIKTYDLLDKKSNTYHGTMTLSSDGASMMVHTKNGYRAINNRKNPEKMQIELGEGHHTVCSADDHIAEQIVPSLLDVASKTNLVENGDFKRVYRMAVITTGEYYTLQGNNNAEVILSVTTAVNGIQAIFEREMAINFELLTPFLYNNADTDPFIPDEAGGDGRVTQAVAAIDAVFDQSSYDIGHVLHQSSAGDNWSGGGVARLRAVCNEGFGSPSKAGGWSGSFQINTNSFFALFAHEVGHMFGAQHTFNGSGGSCQDNISDDTAYEIASGNSIMSYNGICDGDQNIPNGGVNDDYFHAHSLIQMVDHVNGIGDCAAIVQTGNTIPQVSANPCAETFTIPKDTPFFLKASATDVDGDVLTYSWEQYDEDGFGTNTQGFIGNVAANNRNCPIFRSYPPTTDSVRFFPRYDDYINGVFNEFEVLPKIDRSLTFRLTVRDNNPNGSAFAQDELSMNVAASGPFELIAPNGSETISAGDPFTIRWNNNGSEALCDQVNIEMSIDGGFTFPIKIASGINYDDQQYEYTFPPGLNETSNARVKITCVDSECMQFYDLSDTAFNVISDCQPSISSICDEEALNTNQGSEELELNIGSVLGQAITMVTGELNFSDPQTNLSIAGINNVGCTTVSNARFSESTIITVGRDGEYSFDMDHDFGGEFSFFSLFTESNYDPNNSCPSFVGSGARQASPGSSSVFRQDPTLELEACVEYRLVFWTYGGSEVAYQLASITGPGRVYVEAAPDPDFGYTYIAVDRNTNLIQAYDDISDFRDIAPGSYTVFGMSYQLMPTALDLNTIIGKSIIDLAINGDCVQLSENGKDITVETSCFIEDIVVGMRSDCDPNTNTFTVELVVTYQLAPADAMLVVNGQSFALGTSPQTVTLVGLDSDGGVLDVAAGFSTDQFCKLTKEGLITAPENCCPIALDLGESISACVGDDVKLNAGPDGSTYVWSKDGTPLTDIDNEIDVLEDGIYSVIVTNAMGCAKRDQVTVAFVDLPILQSVDNAVLCADEEYQFSIDTDGTDVEIKNGTTTVAANQTNYSINTPGIYTVISKNDAGCATETEFEVIVNALPVVDLGDDIQACESDEVILDAGNDGENYDWFALGVGMLPNTTSTIVAAVSAEYRVTVTSEADCSSTDIIQVDLLPAPTLDFVGVTDTIYFCSTNPGQVTIAVNNPGEDITWTLDGSPFNPTATLSHTSALGGLYEVSSSNSIGCTTTDQLQAIIVDTPIADLGEDIVACIDSEVTLNAGVQADSYQWIKAGAADILSNTDQLVVTETGIYVLTTTNQDLCPSVEDVRVDFVPGPTLDVSADVEICAGESGMLTATTNGDNIQWFKDGVLLNGEENFDLEVSEAGEYTALVLGDSDCEVMETAMVIVNDLPVVDLDGDQAICINDSYMLDANTGVSSDRYTYLLDGTAINVPNTTTMIEIDQAGVYQVIVTNENNCTATESITLTVNALPAVEISGVSTLCIGASGELMANGDGNSFQWFLDNNPVGTNNAILNIDAAGMYSVESTSVAGCSNTDTYAVISVDSPIIDLGDDIDLCPGESVMIDAGSHTTYTWSTGESSPSIDLTSINPMVATTETISVVVTNSATCASTDEVVITFAPVLVGDVVKSSPGVCPEGILTLEATGGLYYEWDNSDGTLSASDVAMVEAMPTASTSYQVTITDDCPNNEAIITVDVPVFDGSNISAGPDTCIVIGQKYEMRATGGVAYDWDNELTIFGSDLIANAEVGPEVTTIYTVEVTDANGCTYSDSIEVCVVDDPLSVFKVISIITPNDDGKNDELVFPGLELYESNELLIFNRWGNVIYEQQDYQKLGELFNGTNGGEKLPADTYFYVLKFDGNTFKSAITIVYQ